MTRSCLPALILLVGCVAADDGGFGTGERTEGQPSDRVPLDTTPDCPAPACPDDECSVGASVDFESDPGGERPCPIPGVCDEDYFTFLELAADEGEPVSLQDLRDSITAIFAGEVDYVTDPVEAETLREVVVETTNLGFLLDGLDERPLTVREVGEQPFGSGRQVDLVIEDPWVGAFQAMLLLPGTDRPHVGVVAHPGHWEEAYEHRDARHARDLVDAGIAVAILDSRAHEADGVESDVTEAMLLGGHSFMAVRVYETLLLRRVLWAHPDVHPDRIGLMGHSGGSAGGNLAVRLDSSWAAYASDFLTEYLYADPDWTYGDETVPRLHPWFGTINLLSTVETPTRLFDYGFPEGGGELVSYYCDQLSED